MKHHLGHEVPSGLSAREYQGRARPYLSPEGASDDRYVIEGRGKPSRLRMWNTPGFWAAKVAEPLDDDRGALVKECSKI